MLKFPTVDTEVTCLGPGSHVYKVDISSCLRQFKTDSSDHDLLGLM